jgi:pyrroloquinoline quinone (PQQ) biosynthesis protein C
MSRKHQFSAEVVAALDEKLNNHPLYASVQTLEQLRLFMAHHVYPVWDFMSLLKYLQSRLAPAAVPWKPHASAATRFFVNQIVLGEESDEGLPDADGNPTYVSHFELYCDAMREIGADPTAAINFVELAAVRGIDSAFALGVAPQPSREFMQATFGFIATDKPHVVAAAFALGREHIIPEMFRSLLARMNITEEQAPAFHYYLKRHIHLDEELHAPLALQMVNELVGGDTVKLREAEEAAWAAIEARIRLWDGVLVAMNQAAAGKHESQLAA